MAKKVDIAKFDFAKNYRSIGNESVWGHGEASDRFGKARREPSTEGGGNESPLPQHKENRPLGKNPYGDTPDNWLRGKPGTNEGKPGYYQTPAQKTGNARDNPTGLREDISGRGAVNKPQRIYEQTPSRKK